MQTFLPYASFEESVACLDNKRLGKQRVEALQIFKALVIPDYGWKNHPAVKMWRGYEMALLWYKRKAILEWIGRGFNNSMEVQDLPDLPSYKMPHWLGVEAFHASHRSNLLRKDPSWYSQYNWTEPDNLPYIWPV